MLWLSFSHLHPLLTHCQPRCYQGNRGFPDPYSFHNGEGGGYWAGRTARWEGGCFPAIPPPPNFFYERISPPYSQSFKQEISRGGGSSPGTQGIKNVKKSHAVSDQGSNNSSILLVYLNHLYPTLSQRSKWLTINRFSV